MKVKVLEGHCKGCLWLGKENVCMFHRCVRHHGFSAEKGDRDNGRAVARVQKDIKGH